MPEIEGLTSAATIEVLLEMALTSCDQAQMSEAIRQGC